ncbi:ATP-NAD kinase [Tothia fuscella]|uniref:ATP-NAD kinase n=1 Tax=Tothia fuscella TaxID=1048955 RepID=A0A9P4U017_9PEZI|nr:ATP-NAD kinase [Tothia fuscella]
MAKGRNAGEVIVKFQSLNSWFLTQPTAEQTASNYSEGRTPSEAEIQEALEVVFDDEGIHRRKSSLVPDESIDLSKVKKQTSCYVHNLLSQHGDNKGTWTPTPDGLARDTFPPDKDPSNASRNNITANTNGAPLPTGASKDAGLGGLGGDHTQHTDSRLLTKKQLSDMALGIRELSKKLSHVQLKLRIRNIFILVKAHDASLQVHARTLAEWLLKKDRHYIVWVENTLENAQNFDAKGLLNSDPTFSPRLKYWDNDFCRRKPQTFDIVLGLGGDGTVLYASWLFQRIVPPVLSFSLGSLGFLTKFEFEEYESTLDRAINEGLTVSLRLRFEATVMRSQKRPNDGGKVRDLVGELVGEEVEDHYTHKPDEGGSRNILNEVVLDRGPSATMSTLEVFGDNEYFTSVQADGICVATPTGSTAYNLAAGGSLCHPENPVILVTAICAHTLSFRPIILPDTIVLRVGVPYDARTGSWASFDGKERVELHPGDYVTISASRFPFPSVLPLDRKKEDWVDSISRTLNWNNRQRQKAFDVKKEAGK